MEISRVKRQFSLDMSWKFQKPATGPAINSPFDPCVADLVKGVNIGIKHRLDRWGDIAALPQSPIDDYVNL